MFKPKQFRSARKSCEFYGEDPDTAALEMYIDSRPELLDDDDSLFGSCISCSQLINEDRLKQLPWAAYCVTCDPRDEEQDLWLELPQAA